MTPATDDMTIREARADEVDAVAAVLAAAYEQYMPPEPMPPVWRAYREEIRDVRARLRDSVQLVADHDGLIGAVSYYPPGGRVSYSSEAESWPSEWAAIRLLAVHPDGRGRGVGRALTDECLRRARDDGAPVMALHTTEFMKVARAMYERMGFTRAPEYDFHPTPDIVVMAYRLGL